MPTAQLITQQIEQWLDEVVIGLNLCPFAAKPRRKNQIQIELSNAQTDSAVLEHLVQVISNLQQSHVLDTTLLVLTTGFDDFYYFNQFLNQVDQLLVQKNFHGEFQIATFHPDYQFANTEIGDKQNLTNRAPYPILHILRENSVEKAIKFYPDAANIPERNIKQMESLSAQDIARLFPYLTKPEGS